MSKARANAAGKTQEKAKAAPSPSSSSARAREPRGKAPEAPTPIREAMPAAAEALDNDNDNAYRIALPQFEGPLDLLLHLIQQHELDILDIPVSFITQKYLAYLSMMRALSIDLASEYLVMAATLTHIKSKMLLPVVPKDQDGDGLPEEEVDPREELVRRLLEYQKYKAAGADLAERGTLGKDIFSRGIPEPVPEGPAPFAPPGVFSLFDALEKLLKRTNVKIEHQVNFDRITITDRIVQLTERLTGRRRATFEELVLDDPARKGAPLTRFDIVITFLAILEMARMKLLRIYQSDPLATIHLELSIREGTSEDDEDASTEAPSNDRGVEREPTEAPSNDRDAEREPTEAPSDDRDVEREPTEAPSNDRDAEREPTEAPSDDRDVEREPTEAPSDDRGVDPEATEAPVAVREAEEELTEAPDDDREVEQEPIEPKVNDGD
ncbi:segregation and condensation protein A [Polyangium sorediatum]|uniref:Segregation and condensation protein A n=1 Tax=Polyangium sorediatum TaxID=889274 RepID=A0ABT6NSH2_9BACT|nr:segregation/condensation protein A [Polyangium sorediatum]MDI1431272.1 segregation/condensation protein A [Polyangium sorediatum]